MRSEHAHQNTASRFHRADTDGAAPLAEVSMLNAEGGYEVVVWVETSRDGYVWISATKPLPGQSTASIQWFAKPEPMR